MPIESRITLKTYFETGDIPTEEQFIDLLDSYFHLQDGNIGNIILTGSIDISGSINATGTASFGFITSSLPSGSDDTVVILDGDNVFRQREIDSRVWGNTLLDGNSLTPFNVPQVLDDNTLTDSIVFASQNDSIGIGTGYQIIQPARLTVSGGISASGMLHAGDITSSNNISASKTISGSAFWTNNANFTTTITASIISASKHISASNVGAHSGHFHHITASVDDITNGNISASGYISASAGDFGDGNITNVGSIFLDTIEMDNGNFVNANTDFFFISGNLVVDEAISASVHVTTNNITASGNVSASNEVSASKFWGVAGLISRLTASNISASGFVSASNVGAAIGTITNITSSNISASGYVSASNVGADTGSIEIINLGKKLQHTGDTTTALSFTNQRAVLGSGLAQIDLSGSNDPLLIKQIIINNNLANTDFLIFPSGSGNNIFRTVARSGSILIGGYSNAGDATLAHNNIVSIKGNVYLDGANGNLTASQNISASGHLSASGIDVGEGNITNVGTIFADALDADNLNLNINADQTFVTGALIIERNVSGAADFFGRHAKFKSITGSAISSSGDVIGNTGSFNHLTTQTLSTNSGSFNYISSTGDISASGDMTADTGSFGHINVKGKISHTGDQANSIDFTTERMILGVGQAQIDISGSFDATKPQEIIFNNTFRNVNTTQFGMFGGGSGSGAPIFKVWAESHSIIIGHNSVPTAPGEFTNTLHDNKAKLGIAGGLHVHKPGTSGYVSDQYIVAQGDVSASGTGSFDHGFVNQDFLTRKIYVGQHFFGGGGIPSASQDNGTARLFISGSGPNNVLVRVMDAASRELLFVSGGVGIGTTNPGKELEVIGDISASGDLEIKNITASVNISASGDLIINDVSASGDISASGALFMSQSAGTDNSVVVLDDSTGKLLTDEIDPKVWNQKLVDYTGTPVNNQIAIFTDLDTIEGDAELTYDGTTLSVDGIVSASGNLTAASASLYSIRNNSGINFLIDGDGDDIDIKNAGVVTIHNGEIEIKAGNAIVNGNISASGHLTASNVGAPIATFTNVTASNYSASGYVSASNIGGASIIGTHITASGNIRAIGAVSYISASMVGATTSLTAPNITASSNISASGTGSFGFLDIDNVTVNNFSGGSITGSSITGSLTGSLIGTSSYAIDALRSLTSSHAVTAVSSSVAALSTTAHTASHAVTASHAILAVTASHALIATTNINNFRTTGKRSGDAEISGSLVLSGSLDATPANLVTHDNITASGHLVLGNSTEIYSGSIDGPNVIILHTTGGLTNFFAGAYAGNSNVVEGEQNIGIGYQAANSLSTGDENVWMGYQAGKDNTSGNRNVAIGRSALENNVTGDGNIAIGYKAGENETGDNKLYIGNDANPILIKGDMAIDEVKIYGLLAATHSISSSGHLFSSNSLSNTSMHQVVVWDSGSGRYYHTGSYGGGGGGGAADNLGNHSASLALFMNSQSINEVNDIRFVSNSSIHDNFIGYSSSAHSNIVEFRDKIQKIIISGSVIRDTRTTYTNYVPENYKLSVGLTGTPATPIANIHVKGDIWASGSNGNITASGHVSASGKVMATTASFGTKATNTTNTAGNVLYVHGNASGSDKIMFATAAFGTSATNTTNTAGNVLYVHGNASGSGKIMFASASFGVPTSNTTNPTGTPLHVRGKISASNDIIAHNFTASGTYNLPATNTAGSGSIFAQGSRVLHFMGSATTFLGKDAGNFNASVGAANIGIGQEALKNIQGGGNNIAIGVNAADNLTTSTDNIAIGRDALGVINNNSNNNVVVGNRAAFSAVESSNNTFIGSNVAELFSNSSFNTAVGYLALSASVGEAADRSIALGYKAGAHNMTASKMFLGNAHLRDDAVDWFSVIEGEMDLTGNTSGSGRATINQILRIFPTGSPGIEPELQVPASFRPGDIICSGSGTVGTKHYLMFYDGTQWVRISNN